MPLGLLPELQSYKDTVRCVVLGKEVRGQHQEQPSQTLIVRLLKIYMFLLFESELVITPVESVCQVVLFVSAKPFPLTDLHQGPVIRIGLQSNHQLPVLVGGTPGKVRNLSTRFHSF